MTGRRARAAAVLGLAGVMAFGGTTGAALAQSTPTSRATRIRREIRQDRAALRRSDRRLRHDRSTHASAATMRRARARVRADRRDLRRNERQLRAAAHRTTAKKRATTKKRTTARHKKHTTTSKKTTG